MSLGGGRFGPPLKVERTEKVWNIKDDHGRKRGYHWIYNDSQAFNARQHLRGWLLYYKFYGAERIVEDNT